MILILSSAIFLATIFPLFSIFQVKKKISVLLVLFLSWYALVVFAAEINGLFGLLSNKWSFLLIQIAEGVIIWFIWIWKGKPDLLFPFRFKDDSNRVKNIIVSLRKNPFTFIFGIIVVAGYTVLAWLILHVPPNNTDSMKTYLPRVIYWLQQDSFNQLTCNSIFAKIYPFDAQLNILWTVLFSNSDKYVGFVQFFSAIFCAIAIFGLARLLNGSRSSAIFIGLVWLTFPIVVFQATSTQVDLVISALFSISIYFMFDFLKQRQPHAIFFSALAMGLAIGTKTTLFMMAPGMLVVIILILLKEKKLIPYMIKWSILTMLFFSILGSYIYIQNFFNYHNPLGPSDVVSGNYSVKTSLGSKILLNGSRLIYQFFSFDGSPVILAEKGISIKEKIFRQIASQTGLNLDSSIEIMEQEEAFSYDMPPSFNEDMAWFGFGSVIILIPSFLLGVYKGFKKKEPLLLYLGILAVTYFFMEILMRPGWDPYQGRYFITSMAILSPMAVTIINEKLFSKIFQGFLGFIAIMIFVFSVFSNEAKPVLGKIIFERKYVSMENNFIPTGLITAQYRIYSLKLYDFFWKNLPFEHSLDFYDDIQLRTFASRVDHENIVRKVNQLVPSDAHMGVMLEKSQFDYVFFGPSLQRILINVNPDTQLFNKEWFSSQHINYLLIGNYLRYNLLPDYIHLIEAVDGWGLFTVED